MLCDECRKRNAMVHMTKNINGKKEEIHLCEVCAKVKEVSIQDHHFSIPHFLAGLMESNIHPQVNMNYHGGLHCHRCGTTLSQVKQSGRMGCAECYETFKDKIQPLIRRIHSNTTHIGKVPRRTGGEIRIKRQISQLRARLQEIVEREEFEEAAEVRDRIKELEQEIKDI